VRLILGIGNPGNRYQFNRHNIGFMFLDFFANNHSLAFTSSPYDYYASEGKIGNSEFALIKPTTFVNNSGIAALDALNNYNISAEDLLVIYDDLNLQTGDFKIKISGGDGGHNGIKSIIYHLISDQFPRLRIGIGSNFEKGRMVEYVLGNFNDEEFNQIKNTFETCNQLVEAFIKGGTKNMLDSNSRLSSSATNNNN
jgi:peptidyl-tRNA hydrolase, PTH1 family